MKPSLYHLPHDFPVWQWWVDIYLAGFATREKAEWYGKLHGWVSK